MPHDPCPRCRAASSVSSMTDRGDAEPRRLHGFLSNDSKIRQQQGQGLGYTWIWWRSTAQGLSRGATKEGLRDDLEEIVVSPLQFGGANPHLTISCVTSRAPYPTELTKLNCVSLICFHLKMQVLGNFGLDTISDAPVLTSEHQAEAIGCAMVAGLIIFRGPI